MSFMQSYGDYIVQEYRRGRGTSDIAKELGTYTNKVRRVLLSRGEQMRDQSEAQKIALASGRVAHPTKGKKRSLATKKKISKKVKKYWDNLSEEEYNKKVEQGKERWNAMTDEQKEEMRHLALEAVREASVNGSKIEHFVKGFLEEEGWDVIFHKVGLIPDEKLEVDLFVPDLALAIEIDGPSHFLPIWSEERMIKHMKADQKKNGLLVSHGFRVLRVKYLADNFALHHKETLKSTLSDLLADIHSGKNDKNFMELELG